MINGILLMESELVELTLGREEWRAGRKDFVIEAALNNGNLVGAVGIDDGTLFVDCSQVRSSTEALSPAMNEPNVATAVFNPFFTSGEKFPPLSNIV